MNSGRIRNVAGFIVIYATAFGLWLISPDPAVKQAHVMCQGHTVAVYPDMNACSMNDRFKSGECACFRPPNEWSRWYNLAGVPLLATVAGFLVLRASRTTRLILLNAAIAVAVVSELIHAVIVDPVAIEGVLAYPPLLAAFCAGASVLFVLLDVVRGRLRRIGEGSTP